MVLDRQHQPAQNVIGRPRCLARFEATCHSLYLRYLNDVDICARSRQKLKATWITSRCRQRTRLCSVTWSLACGGPYQALFPRRQVLAHRGSFATGRPLLQASPTSPRPRSSSAGWLRAWYSLVGSLSDWYHSGSTEPWYQNDLIRRFGMLRDRLVRGVLGGQPTARCVYYTGVIKRRTW